MNSKPAWDKAKRDDKSKLSNEGIEFDQETLATVIEVFEERVQRQNYIVWVTQKQILI